MSIRAVSTVASVVVPLRRSSVEHEVKCWPESFRAIVNGGKRHEVCRADRDYRPGDHLLLREFDPAIGPSGAYTGVQIVMRIGHVTAPGSCGLPDDLCVFTLLYPTND